MKLSIGRPPSIPPPHPPIEEKKEAVKKKVKDTPKPSDTNPKAKGEKTSGTVIRSNPAEFAAMVAREIMKNFSSLRVRPKDIHIDEIKDIPAPEGENLILVDTSVLIDGRILPIVNSGFLAGTLLVPQFVLGEVQHIADS